MMADSVTAREVSGRLVLITLSPPGTVVISGGAPQTVLWRAGARIEAGDAG